MSNIFNQILDTSRPLALPLTFDGVSSDLLLSMLKQKAPTRLGMLVNGAGDLWAHEWFRAFDASILESRGLAAPYTPTVCDVPRATKLVAPVMEEFVEGGGDADDYSSFDMVFVDYEAM